MGVVPAVHTISLLSGKVEGSYARTPTEGIPVSRVKSVAYSRTPTLLYFSISSLTRGSLTLDRSIAAVEILFLLIRDETCLSITSQIP